MGVITLTGLADQSIQVSKAFVRLDNRIHRVFSSHFSPLYRDTISHLLLLYQPNRLFKANFDIINQVFHCFS